MTEEIEVIKNLKPLLNLNSGNSKLLDCFGFHKTWDKNLGWNYNSLKGPINTGVFFGIDRGAIVSPCLSTIMCSKLIRTEIYFTNIKPIISEYRAARHINIVVSKYDLITSHKFIIEAGEVIPKATIKPTVVKYSIIVSEALGKALVDEGILNKKLITPKMWKSKARENGLPVNLAYSAVLRQMETIGIQEVYEDFIIRSKLPKYKKYFHPSIEKEFSTFWEIDPLKVGKKW